MTIIASAPVNLYDATRCPTWCIMHCPGEDGAVLHLSDIAELVPTAGGPAEQRPLEVSVEQLQRTATGSMDDPRVRLADTPMTPDEALHLAGLLVLAARRAMERAR